MSQTSPTITSLDRDAIRTTFAVAAANPQATSARFYTNLFKLDPSLRALFHGDMSNQGEKLMSMLGFIVSHLEKLDLLLPTVRQLGQRHAGYGVQAAHYATVGQALMEALKQQAGAAWTAGADTAWQKAYQLLSDNMIAAAQVPGVTSQQIK